jgi:hypothetical protein
MSDEVNKFIRPIVFSIIFLALILFVVEIFIFANAKDIWQDEVTQLYGVNLGPQVSPHLRDPKSAGEARVLAEEFCVSLDERT